MVAFAATIASPPNGGVTNERTDSITRLPSSPE